MGFNLVPKQDQVNITINNLTPKMMSDLIRCYAADVSPENFESRFMIPQGIFMDYPIVPKQVVEEFYQQLDMVKGCIKDVIICNYHTGIEGTDSWIQGTLPTDIQDLKDTVFMIIIREFENYSAEWIYAYTQGDFNNMKPFVDAIVDACVMYTSGGDFNTFVTLIQEHYTE